MSFLKPYTTLGVGLILGYLVIPRVIKLVHK
jgi:hypothetical protein